MDPIRERYAVAVSVMTGEISLASRVIEPSNRKIGTAEKAPLFQRSLSFFLRDPSPCWPG